MGSGGDLDLDLEGDLDLDLDLDPLGGLPDLDLLECDLDLEWCLLDKVLRLIDCSRMPAASLPNFGAPFVGDFFAWGFAFVAAFIVAWEGAGFPLRPFGFSSSSSSPSSSSSSPSSPSSSSSSSSPPEGNSFFHFFSSIEEAVILWGPNLLTVAGNHLQSSCQ